VWVGRTVTLEVRNPLPSASTARRLESMSGGYGLVGLRERVTLVGGRLAAGPEDGDWVVRAELPASAAGAGRAP